MFHQSKLLHQFDLDMFLLQIVCHLFHYHFLPVSHAFMAALQQTPFGVNTRRVTSGNPEASSHHLPFSHALITAFQLTDFAVNN